MRKITFLSILFCVFSMTIRAQSSSEINIGKVQSLDNTLSTLYSVISGEKGQERDWELFKYLFHPDAKLIPSGKNKAGVYKARYMTPEDYIKEGGQWLVENGFFEKEIHRSVISFGNITQVFSTYASFNSEADKKPFTKLSAKAQEHYGELVAMDRSIGTLRRGLRELGVEQNTLLWFTSDNGGLPGFDPDTTGGLRGYKGSMYEGGLRVPAIIEWPKVITKPRITKYPAGAVDIFPTIAQAVGLPASSMLQPQDGLSLVSLFTKEIGPRKKVLPFRSRDRVAIIDNDYKLISMQNKRGAKLELYNLAKDTAETANLFEKEPKIARRMQMQLEVANASIESSVLGKDYPEGKVNQPQPPRIFWHTVDAYKPFFPEWSKRPEYGAWLKRRLK